MVESASAFAATGLADTPAATGLQPPPHQPLSWAQLFCSPEPAMTFSPTAAQERLFFPALKNPLSPPPLPEGPAACGIAHNGDVETGALKMPPPRTASPSPEKAGRGGDKKPFSLLQEGFPVPGGSIILDDGRIFR